MAGLRRGSGTSLDDDAALLEMARCVLGGPSDEGRSTYQIALTVGAACGTARQDASGDAVSVAPTSSEWQAAMHDTSVESTCAPRTTPASIRHQLT
jgi:hypothetical protein